MAFDRTIWRMLAPPMLLAVAACVPQDGAPNAARTAPPGASVAPKVASAPSMSVVTDVTGPQPRTATYSCADGGRMTVENLGTSVRVLGADGVSEELPASPANQSSRYGQAHDAIVIDGRDLLVMKAGARPLACKR
ncbi:MULTISPECIES: hypothetical protein [unclassified Mesorhizobium]|uniref:hypothetical protein n=1 Tax=unclassified Mesorhizobium TaxID=325217 RepID=UPI000964DC08|nr:MULTISPECIES: hypothetical protein [unclassified Mesorhizobium]MBN9257309.1 hypothetical protein [Mesorhizobium sp.]OJX80578.1 MAG: hypothetical protein BGO93_00780 [Mesorhizobium sp. 65-26]